ncbi:hypothetical protein CHUAL_001430 [Chamberlinius hualienensis]
MQNIMRVLKRIVYLSNLHASVTTRNITSLNDTLTVNQTYSSQKLKNQVEPQDYSFSKLSPSVEIYPKLLAGKLTKEYVIELLSDSLGCNSEVAQMLCSDYPQLNEVYAPVFIESVKFLKDCGFSVEEIVKNFKVLFDSLATLKRKKTILSPLNLGEEMLVLMQLDMSVVSRLVKGWEINETVDEVTYCNRLDYFKAVLKCQCDDLLRFPTILTGNFNKYKFQLQLLLKHGFKPQDIVSNLRIFVLTADKTEYRLNKIHLANVGPVDLRFLMTDDHNFEKAVSKWVSFGNELTPECNLEKYLMKKLQCNQQYIEWLYTRCGRLKNVRVQQAKLIVDYVTSLGFAANDVCVNPYIFKMDVDVLKARHAEMAALGYTSKRLSVYILSETSYQKFIKNLNNNQSNA